MRFDGDIVIVFGFLCYIIVRGIALAAKKKNKTIITWFKEFIWLLLALYTLMLISVTLFPLYIGIPHKIFSYSFINYIPIISIIRETGQIGTAYGGDTLFMIKLIVKNVGGNILLLMPLGFLAPLLWESCKRIKNILIVGFLVSLGIESLQFVEILLGLGMARAVDIDDVICNVLGAVLGFLIYKLIIKLLGGKIPASMKYGL